jgi:hypothetical protein
MALRHPAAVTASAISHGDRSDPCQRHGRSLSAARNAAAPAAHTMAPSCFAIF